LFLNAVASGRNTSKDYIVASYGQGGTMIAKKALEVGMIDSIGKSGFNAQGGSEQNLTANTRELKLTMNIAELQASHPELYTQVLDAGKKAEQERAAAFVELGEASGASDLAMECIKNGTEHSAAINAKFVAAQMKNDKLSALVEDNVDTKELEATTESKEKTLEELTLEALSNNGLEMY
jgi:hypothetical protein